MKKQSATSGFTIVELLIATAVFSVILLVISGGIIQIGRLYYKGITSARTQETARSVMSGIAETIQFNKGQVVGISAPSYSNLLDGSGGNRAICIANKHYSFKFGQQRTGSSHALAVRDVPDGCQITIAQNMSGTLASDSQELLGENMRLANLVVERQGLTDSYKVIVRVVYGDRDLLCKPGITTGPSSCTSKDEWTDDAAISATRDLSCKNIPSGTQFCAASELSTIVKRRLSDD